MLMGYQFIKRFFFFLSIFLIQLSLLIVATSYQTQAATCELNGPDGSWKLVRSLTGPSLQQDKSCDLLGAGTLTSSDGTSFTYELIQGEKKATEVVKSCERFHACGVNTYANWDCTDCYACIDDQRVWSPCLSSGTGLPDCVRSSCASDTNLWLGFQECGNDIILQIRRYAGYGACGGSSVRVDCLSPTVTSRTLERWVCNSCTSDPITQMNHFQQLVETCGGAENMLFWDNASCTGVCKPDPQNQGPPCPN